MVHAAISGSTNCLLHLPAIAHEYGIEVTGENLEGLKKNVFYEKCNKWLEKCNERFGTNIKKEDISERRYSHCKGEKKIMKKKRVLLPLQEIYYSENVIKMRL